MQQVGEFEKVSYQQFYKDMKNCFPDQSGMFSEEFRTSIREIYDAVQLPTRATSGSAGYDFKAPFGFDLAPGETMLIPTGIRVKIDEGWWLGCLPRSGLGFKYRLQLDNTMGVIDSDYYGSDNEGHIFARVTNDGKLDKDVSIKAGDGFMQAIFIPYGITYSDDARSARNGGLGSTGA